MKSTSSGFFALRAVVLALGETSTPPWWRSEFMSDAGFRFLERLYPRTYFSAAVQPAEKAACDAHDKAVGRVGVYHLFRLPEALETEMSRLGPNFDEQFLASFRAALGNQDKLLDLLLSLSDGASDTETPAGAHRIGTDQDLMSGAAVKKTAAVYRRAFAHGKPGFPYFTVEPIGGRE